MSRIIVQHTHDKAKRTSRPMTKRVRSSKGMDYMDRVRQRESMRGRTPTGKTLVIVID